VVPYDLKKVDLILKTGDKGSQSTSFKSSRIGAVANRTDHDPLFVIFAIMIGTHLAGWRYSQNGSGYAIEQ
jgi:hypothetical protein